MDLIKRIYRGKNENLEQNNTTVLFDEMSTMEKVMNFLSDVHYLDTDLYIPEVVYNFSEIFNRLEIGLDQGIFLQNIQIGSSRYNMLDNGYCSFNYSLGNTIESNDDNTITYYSSNELFPGEKYAIYPGVKLSSGNESLYYSVGSVPILRQYSIKLNEELTLIREYSQDEVLFTIRGINRDVVIRIKKPISKVVENDYLLDNEILVLDYLKTLTNDYDVIDVYIKLCELSLGKDVSVFQEIKIYDSVKKGNKYFDNNLISIKNGNIESLVRTIGDKTITLFGNGNWIYELSDEFVDFRIDSGKTMKYHIETKSERDMDDYTDGLLRYDINNAKREVEETRELVRRRCKL